MTTMSREETLTRYRALREISKRIQAMLQDRQVNVDETTQAHLEECREAIARVLSASTQAND